MATVAQSRLARPSSVVAIACAVAFVLLAVVVAERGAIGFDDPVIALVTGLPISTDAWVRITEAGGSLLIPIGIGVVLGLLLARRPRSALVYGIALLGASAWTQWFKVTIARARPPGDALAAASGFSFPSGHTLNSTVTYGVIALLVWRSGLPAPARRLVTAILAAIPVLVGLSRIALGVHYPSDVVGGWLGGIAIVATVATLTDPDPDRAARDKPRPEDHAQPPAAAPA